MVQLFPSSGVESKSPAGEFPAAVGRKGPAGDGFFQEVRSRIQEVNALQNTADRAMEEGAVKGAANVHETMIQMEKADLSLRMMLRVRDKAISAYQEIMRMQF